MLKQKNNFSHLTAIERINLSLPIQFLLENNLLKGEILDFGCGFGNDVKLLQKKGFKINGYDPHYFPDYPENKFDTIVCCYVLNVLFTEQQSNVLMAISHLLKPGGKAYYAVRRDIKKEGFREHYVHKKPTYQCIVKLPFKSLKLEENYEIYEYTHYNYQRNSSNNCLFCNPRQNLKLITESATAYAILDGYPLSNGHTLVIPKRHVSNYFDLPFKEQSACWLMVNKVQEILNQEFKPDGFNVGMNVNREAGQNMMHVSIHIVPRYGGDVMGAKSGMRCVIPQKK
ncbi:bifunctional class I SAM-dependent methyltransferase/HIT family protein [Calothrix sp. PCC 6303]|uniref:bifunctional class I SAM-dependent methyltransferase/HIT family protein n=1 Tax=Calothrix sp. PCC 6303 TaxID=1170562 RepID=UPI0002A01D51|nr:bifunctional class I SAM-dependent methyltransferase/HIT family protein [Calothrix sp. PCC 6303]AFZ03136.1 histidine triad (HIT) protein [Calothrix sp. PCC 6303]